MARSDGVIMSRYIRRVPLTFNEYQELNTESAWTAKTIRGFPSPEVA